MQEVESVRSAVQLCSTTEAPLMVYVSKMIAVPASILPRVPGQPGPSDMNAEVFLAFARVFSGVIVDGDTVQVLSAAYNPLTPEQDCQEVKVWSSFLVAIFCSYQSRIQSSHTWARLQRSENNDLLL